LASDPRLYQRQPVGYLATLDASSVQAKTLKRARDAYDQLVDYIEMQVRGVWAHSAEVVREALKTPGGKVS
jgi:hypothetical protein